MSRGPGVLTCPGPSRYCRDMTENPVSKCVWCGEDDGTVEMRMASCPDHCCETEWQICESCAARSYEDGGE